MINNAKHTDIHIKDTFNGPSLDTPWEVSAGLGEYSLSARPGYLRYSINASHTAHDAGSGQGYAKALALVRPFAAHSWQLKTAVTCNLRPGQPTNNRNLHFTIRAHGARGTRVASITRSIGSNDANKGSNALTLVAGNQEKAFYFANSPDSLPEEDWIWAISQHGNRITVEARKGQEHFGCTGLLSKTPLGKKVVEIQGDGWHGSNTPAGYADFDYLTIQGSGEPLPAIEQTAVESIEGVGHVNAQKLGAADIRTVKDLAKANLAQVHASTNLSLLALYSWQKRAQLCADSKLAKSLIGGILQAMSIGEAVETPDNELAKISGQPLAAIRELKLTCASVLISLDNSAVTRMPLLWLSK